MSAPTTAACTTGWLDDGSQESLVELYERAQALNAIDRHGIRVRFSDDPQTWMRVRVFRARSQASPDDGAVWQAELQAQRHDGAPIGTTTTTATATWDPGQPAAEPFLRLTERLQVAHAYPGEASFDPADILRALAGALHQAIELRTAPDRSSHVRPIAEIVNPDWALTEPGLDSLRHDLRAEADELAGAGAPAAWERLSTHPLLQQDAQQETLKQAFDLAQDFHARRAQERAEREPWKKVLREADKRRR